MPGVPTRTKSHSLRNRLCDSRKLKIEKLKKKKKKIHPSCGGRLTYFMIPRTKTPPLSNNECESDPCQIGQPTFNPPFPHESAALDPRDWKTHHPQQATQQGQNIPKIEILCNLDSQTYKTKIYLFIFLI